MEYISILRIFLSFILVLSGILKLFNLFEFYKVVLRVGILKGFLAKLFAYSWSFIQIIVGILLFLRIQVEVFSFILVLMMLVSLIGVGYSYFHSKKIDNCMCWGRFIKSPINGFKIFENVIWFILSLILYLGLQ